ncbi:MAG: alkaline phosphatase PhoX [Pseudomonadota bacterium]|uniref:alkaline phosphatase PhoX n=1 Tax=Alteromonas sp. MTD1 TaxID=3057962 RepID=UPI002EA871A0|nr:alkaline phosphatase PhoX [Pseudomonadota bacterium]
MKSNTLKHVKYSAIALAVTLSMTACSLEGDDGADGVQGPVGEQGPVGDQGPIGEQGPQGDNAGTLTRIATVPLGAEVTGIFLSEEGDLFFNVQHPSGTNTATNSVNEMPINTGTVGVLAGANFNNLPVTLPNSPVPSSDEEKQLVMTAIGQYQVLGQTGDTFDADLPEGLGHIYTLDGAELVLENDMPDFNGFISTADNEGYLFSNWEELPGGMSRMKVEKDQFGMWEVTEAMMLDFSPVWGTAANCFGSMSPWNTPLTSEEWVVNSSVDTTTSPSWNDPEAVSTNARLGRMWQMTAPDAPNPYNYGYIAEVTEPLADEPVIVKHFTMGRYEHENSTVMPDGKTVYLSQDDTGGVLFKFVADTAEDLSAGTLYGAKLTQDAGQNDPATTGFTVEWVELASGDNMTIRAWIDEYNGIGTDDYVDGQSSYITMADVQAWADGDANYPSVEDGGSSVTAGQPMDDRVVFLESRAAARLKGATAEWRKLEGISINQKRAQEAVEGVDTIEGEVVQNAYLYIGIADIDNTMTDGEGDMQLSARVKDCGGVYRARLEAGYNISRIEPVVMGGTYRSSLTGAERCDVNQLSQPDNVIVMNDGRILIGEDGFQENNTLWMYEPANK